MSFNVSRFLVRVRQFWTRKRLVPVLGVTALFLFGLTSYQYLSSLFAHKPIIATHISIIGNSLHSIEGHEADVDYFFWEFDHADRHNRWHHKKWNHEHLRHKMEWDIALDQKRRALELHEMMKENQRLEIKNRVLKFQSDDDDDKVIIMHEGGNNDDVLILREDGEETFEITINGKKIKINKHKEI